MLTKRTISAEIVRLQNRFADENGKINYTRKVQGNTLYLDKEIEGLFNSFKIPFIVDSFDDDASVTILMTFILNEKLERISISIP